MVERSTSATIFVPPAGLKPATSRLAGGRSVRLNYGGITHDQRALAYTGGARRLSSERDIIWIDAPFLRRRVSECVPCNPSEALGSRQYRRNHRKRLLDAEGEPLCFQVHEHIVARNEIAVRARIVRLLLLPNFLRRLDYRLSSLRRRYQGKTLFRLNWVFLGNVHTGPALKFQTQSSDGGFLPRQVIASLCYLRQELRSKVVSGLVAFLGPGLHHFSNEVSHVKSPQNTMGHYGWWISISLVVYTSKEQ